MTRATFSTQSRVKVSGVKQEFYHGFGVHIFFTLPYFKLFKSLKSEKEDLFPSDKDRTTPVHWVSATIMGPIWDSLWKEFAFTDEKIKCTTFGSKQSSYFMCEFL